MPNSDATRIALVEQGLATLRENLDAHEKRQDEFMLRTYQQLEQLLKQSDEWRGVRKTLTIFVTSLTIISGVIGWVVHAFWPNWPRG